MREQGDEGGVPMYSEDDRLLPWYTLGERSCELHQRSAFVPAARSCCTSKRAQRYV